MRKRLRPRGDRNIIGEKVELRRKEIGMKQKELLLKLQVNGVRMDSSALSKIEGQLRSITDIELSAIADVLGVTADWLLGREK